jgi:5-methyltetrahydropteroyltriglutamate--homocysteine methyltransferase
MIVSTLGFPRIGPRRELKQALEQHWAGEIKREGTPRDRRRAPRGDLGA